MAEEQTGKEVHPGSFVGDTIEEFKKLPTWGKVAVGLVVVAVIVFVWYQKTHGTGPNITGTQPIPGGIPSGDTPVYDPNGNIIGYTQPLGPGGGTPSPTPTPSPPPPTPVPPPPGFQWPSQLNGMKIWQGTVSHNFFFGPLGPQPHEKDQTLLSTLFPSGTIFSVLPNGDLGYQLPGGQVVDSGVQLTNGNPPGGGGDKNGDGDAPLRPQIQSHNLTHNSAPQAPKLGSHVVQPGETPSRIAAAHRVSTQQLTAANPQTPIRPGQRLIVPRGDK